jgi:hypothetical protein
MSIFRKAMIEQAFLKAGYYGMAGSGKTVTASLLMIGTILEARKRNLDYANKPVFFVDTEGGSDFLVPVFEHFGVEFYVAKTRAFTDLIPAHEEAAKNGGGIITDSVSHPWREFMESYKRKRKRSYIAFEDWDYLKTEWGKFTTTFTNGSVHAIICGRAGYEYEDSTNEETGKREINKVGTRMKTEGEMAFEPSLLIEMVAEQNLQKSTLSRIAYVRKDRFMVTDGKEFNFPSIGNEPYEDKLERVWAAFSPHVMLLNWGSQHRGVDTTRTSDASIPGTARPEHKKRSEEKEILMEKTQNLFTKHGFSGQSKDGKTAIMGMLSECYGTDSWKQIEFNYSLEQVRDGFDKLHIKLEGTSYFSPPVQVPANGGMDADEKLDAVMQ